MNTASLCNEILPKYFKTNRIESLIRQLHSCMIFILFYKNIFLIFLDGFRKIASAKSELYAEKMEFANRFFKRDHPDLLANICKNYQTKPNLNLAAQNLQVISQLFYTFTIRFYVVKIGKEAYYCPLSNPDAKPEDFGCAYVSSRWLLALPKW